MFNMMRLGYGAQGLWKRFIKEYRIIVVSIAFCLRLLIGSLMGVYNWRIGAQRVAYVTHVNTVSTPMDALFYI